MSCSLCRKLDPTTRVCAFETPRADLSRQEFSPANFRCGTLLELRRRMFARHSLGQHSCFGPVQHEASASAVLLVWRPDDDQCFTKAAVFDERMDPLAVPLTLSFAERVLSERSAA